MFDRAVNEEKKRWADYLFKDGSMIGLNDKLLHQYVEWIANRQSSCNWSKPVYDIAAVTIHCLGLNIGFLPRVFRLHHKKQRLNPTLLEVSSKMFKKRSQDSNCSGNCGFRTMKQCCRQGIL